MMRSDKKNRIFKAISYAMAFIAVSSGAWIVFREGVKVPWEEFHFSSWILAASLFVSSIGFVPATLAWRKILGVYGIHNRFWDDLKNYVYTMLGTLVPGGIWQIVGRSAVYKTARQSGFFVAIASLDEILFFGIAGWLIFSVVSILFPVVNPLKTPVVSAVVLAVICITILPVCFNAIHRFVFRIFNRGTETINTQYAFKQLSICVLWELLTLSIGSSAVFLLLASFYPVTFQSLFFIAAAYCFSVSFTNIFFWLPGSLILKDSSMVFALATFMPVSFAIICVLIIRIWTIFSVLVPFCLVWILNHFIKKTASSQ